MLLSAAAGLPQQAHEWAVSVVHVQYTAAEKRVNYLTQSPGLL